MVRSLFASLISARMVASTNLLDVLFPIDILPKECTGVVTREGEMFRDRFDAVLRDAGHNEESVKDLTPVVSHINIPMRDGVTISTCMLKPPIALVKHTAIVTRSPYGTPGSNLLSVVFNLMDQAIALIQDQRGCSNSGGEFDLWSQESQDSTDVAEWISQQSWSNGEVLYTGISADGIPGNMALLENPTYMKGEWLMWTASGAHPFIFPQGAYRQDLMRSYLGDTISGGDGVPGTHGTSRDVTLPKLEAKESYDSWWEKITVCHGESHCYYGNVNWPIIDSSGWWDLFQHTHLTHWKGIRAQSNEAMRDNHVLIMGPLGHCSIGNSPIHNTTYQDAENTAFLVGAKTASELFKGNFHNRMRSKIGRVNLYVQGNFHEDSSVESGNYWTSLDEFPNPEPAKFFLNADGVLGTQVQTTDAVQQYVYDPSAEDGATPMLGGNNLPLPTSGIDICGPTEQQSRTSRSDVITFDSEPLSADMPIAGEIFAQLYVSSSAKDTDFFVTVEDLDPNTGKSILVRYGMARMRWRDSDVTISDPLEADQVYPIEIDLWASAYIFPEGHSVRVSVSSAAYPYYSLNPNTGNALYAADDEPVAATNAVHMSTQYRSSLSLPVVSMADIPENPDFHPVLSVLV